jgi:hypothetical protein
MTEGQPSRIRSLVRSVLSKGLLLLFGTVVALLLLEVLLSFL